MFFKFLSLHLLYNYGKMFVNPDYQGIEILLSSQPYSKKENLQLNLKNARLTNLSALYSLSSFTSIPSTLDYMIKYFCKILGKIFMLYFYIIYFLISSWISIIYYQREVFYGLKVPLLIDHIIITLQTCIGYIIIILNA